MFRRVFSSLLFQLTALGFAIAIITGMFSSFYLDYQVRRTVYGIMEERANDLATELGYSIASLLYHNDMVTIQRIVERTSTLDDVQDVVVVDYLGNVIAAKNFTLLTAKGGPSYAEYGLDWADVLELIQHEQTQAAQGPGKFAIVMPIHGQTYDRERGTDVIGAVVVQMNMASVELQLRSELTERGLFNVFLVVMISAEMMLIAYATFVHPLRRVVAATREFAAGHLSVRLPDKGSNEIKTLSAAFNGMAADLERYIHQLVVLHDISSTVSTTLDLDEMLNYLANHFAHLVDGTGAFILFWDEERQIAIPKAAYQQFNTIYQEMEPAPGEPTLTSSVVAAQQPIAVYDVFNSPHVSSRVASHFPDKSLLGVPLIANGVTLGAVLIGESRHQREFSANEIRLVQSAAGQVASAIYNAKLYMQLKAERNRLNDILNTMADAIILLDTEWQIRYVNPAFATILQTHDAMVMDQPIQVLFQTTPDAQCPFQKLVHSTWEYGKTWHQQITMHRPQGELFDADVILAAVRGPDALPNGYVMSIRDITEQKELDRMKIRFVSNVSHELRTPLSVIALYAENLFEYYDQLSDIQRRDIARDIGAESATLQQLIEQLLQLSRLDAGKSEPRYAAGDLREIVSESFEHAQRIAKSKQLKIECHLPDRPVPLVADRDQLLQVFRNLLSNAIKFTPEGKFIYITLNVSDQYAVVQVRDTGVGIPASELPHIFERFYRGKFAVTQEVDGTGLGLAITQEIILRHHGSIQAQSQVGQGTTFHIRLPLTHSQTSA
jgi:PAS domain S-box-containing protein